MPSLSVIIPAYNEEQNITDALNDVLKEVASVISDIEIIVVDDGSSDRTAALALDIAAKDNRVAVISQPNQGHGPALMNGVAIAKGDWIFVLDSDRQVSLENFSQHWALNASHDVVLGFRKPRRDPPHRLIVSTAMRLLLRLILGIWVRDAGAPYKLVRSNVWREASRSMREGCWIPSVLMAARALQRTDLNVIEIPIKHQPRQHGPSTLNLRRLAEFCKEGVADIAYFHARSRRSDRQQQ